MPDHRRALQALDEAIAVVPDPEPLIAQAAEILDRIGDFSGSEQRWRELLARKRQESVPALRLAGSVNRQGRVDEALRHFRAAGRMPEVRDAARQSLLLSMHYSDRETPARIFREHRAWAHSIEKEPPPGAPVICRNRALRIGYVSGDFRQHACAHFFEPLLAHHHSKDVEVHCFSNVPKADRMTAHLRRMSQGWHELGSLSDDEAANAIRRLRIDILVDLSGHTAYNRLGVFARRAAPIQVTYLGYPDTTGLRAMDYRFTDCIADPPGKTEHLHSEKLVRLDPCFLCFRPWWQRLPVGPPPCEEAGFVTLASFAIREKLSPTVLEAWARILALAPRARLVLKCHAMSDTSVRQQLRDFFSARGIADRRLIFAGSVPSARQHLECYRHVDLVLDPYPYNGTTVTCEALWMGVPTVTWAGETHVSRVGASVLSQVGLQELIAHSAAEYVQKAVEAACSPQRLMEWRRTLRRRMHGSPLMDGERFAGAVEEAYRKMRRA